MQGTYCEAVLSKARIFYNEGDFNNEINQYRELEIILSQIENVALNIYRAVTLKRLGNALSEQGYYDEAISCFNRIDKLFAKQTDGEIIQIVIQSRFNKAVTFGDMGSRGEEIKIYDQIINDFNNGYLPESTLETVIDTFYNKGLALGKLGQINEEIDAYNDLLKQFYNYEDEYVRTLIAETLYNKGITLRELGKHQDAIEAFDSIITTFKTEENENIKTQVAKAFLDKGVEYGSLGMYIQEIATYDTLIDFAKDVPFLLTKCAEAMYNKGIVLSATGNIAGAKEIFQKLTELSANKDNGQILKIVKRLEGVLNNVLSSIEFQS